MKKANAFITLCVIASASVGCCSKTSQPVDVQTVAPSGDDYVWFQYPLGNRVFKNEAGLFDTVVNYEAVIKTLDFSAGAYSTCKTYSQQQYLSSAFSLVTDSGTQLLAVLTAGGSYGAEIQMKVGTSDYDRKLLSLPDTAMTVNNLYFSDVTVLDTLADYYNQSLFVKKAYYSKSKGFVKYIKPDNTAWELIN